MVGQKGFRRPEITIGCLPAIRSDRPCQGFVFLKGGWPRRDQGLFETGREVVKFQGGRPTGRSAPKG